MEIIRTDPDDLDFRALVALLDEELAVRDGAQHSFYAQFNKIDRIGHIVIAYAEGEAAGCGAFKEYSDGVAEIKRMFVRPEYRSRGIAGTMLNELENWAIEAGYSECILETGLKQPEAVRLYEKSGYTRIPNYGQYEGVENSVCMRKEIS